MIRSVAFVESIVVLGTSKRQDRFEAPEWEITTVGQAIKLRRPASQNVPEVPAFEVHGVGFCMTARRFDVPAIHGGQGGTDERGTAGEQALAQSAPAQDAAQEAPVTQTRRRNRKR